MTVQTTDSEHEALTTGQKVWTATKIVVPIIIGVIIAFLPPPEMLTREAMIYMGIFMWAILWLIFDIISDYLVVTLSMAMFVLFNISDFPTVFAPFAGPSVWLVIGAFGISAMVAKVGLLRRVAFKVLSVFPENFKGQITALFATGVVIAPMIPSLTAKAAILGSFASEAAESLGYKKSSRPATGFFNASWIASGVLGMAFLSGAVPVFTILGFMSPEQAAEFSWVRWFSACVVWLVVVLVLSYVAVLWLNKPREGELGSEVETGFVKRKLEELGPMTRDEKVAAVFLAAALIGWILGDVLDLSATVWALVIFVGMAGCGLMTPKEFSSRISWSTVYFVGGIFSLAAMITNLEINKWLATILGPILEPVIGNLYVFIPVVVIATYLLRFVVISQTAATAIFLAALGGVSTAAGIHPFVLLFTVYVSTLVWHFKFTNVTYLAALGATDDKLTTHAETQSMNVAYMVINLIACTASIPLWQAMGMA